MTWRIWWTSRNSNWHWTPPKSLSAWSAKTLTTPGDFGEGVVNPQNKLSRPIAFRHEVNFCPTRRPSSPTPSLKRNVLDASSRHAASEPSSSIRDVRRIATICSRTQAHVHCAGGPHRRLEITERIDAQGDVVIPLAQDEIEKIVEEIKALNVDAVVHVSRFWNVTVTREHLGRRCAPHCRNSGLPLIRSPAGNS